MRRVLFLLTLVIWLAVLPLYAKKVHDKTDYTDFDVYYRAASRTRAHAWGDVYTLKDGASPLRYAPSLLPVLRPLAWLGASSAKLSWFFLQWLFFTAGFAVLYATLRRIRPRLALSATCLSLLFTLRFCLDTFTIGQVSSLLFFGFCVSLYGWQRKRPVLAAAGIFLPASFKVGPAVLFGMFGASSRPSRRALFGTALGILAASSLICLVWVGSWATFLDLWRGWGRMLALDSVYYDSSHYGSQSLNSWLLRLAKTGVISRALADGAHFWSTALGTLALLAFWWLRRPRTPAGRAHFFSLGLFAVFWFMPETFKYSLTPIAIPFALLVCAREKTPLSWLALIFSTLALSLSGKDLLDPIHPALFFRLQELSFPFFATLLLGVETMRQAWVGSEARYPRSAKSPGAWDKDPEPLVASTTTFLVPVSFARSVNLHERLLEELRETARACGADEVLLLPYGEFHSPLHPIHQALEAWSRSGARLLAPQNTRFVALRAGFLRSHGQWIAVVNPEQPCTTPFYVEALARLRAGTELVRANRRLPESRFRLPVRLLSMVYGRHRLGLAFNRLARLALPLGSTDTQSGSYALNRKLALEAFALHAGEDFLFDLELSITAAAQNRPEADLAVCLQLTEEKSRRRVFSEAMSILFGLPRLAWRYRRGFYSGTGFSRAISADDWGLSPGVNAGILELARLGVVRRVALMANCQYVGQELDALKRVPGVELGLHFNLTYGPTALARGPGALLARWMLARFTGRDGELAERARTELVSQLRRLRELGVRPVYMDGHHHIHLVPGLLAAIAPLLRAEGIAVVRTPYDPALWRTRLFALNLLALGARREVRRLGFRSLPCFYPMPRDFADPARLIWKLREAPDAEVIVHPSTLDDVRALAIPDSYSAGRVTEYRALRMLQQRMAPPL